MGHILLQNEKMFTKNKLSNPFDNQMSLPLFTIPD